MDDPDITMEEYIQLMADNDRSHGETFNWETVTYGKVYCEDLDSFADFETDFTAIVYNDASTSYYTFIYDKDSLSHKLILVDDLKPKAVNDHVEICTELCSENIDIKPMDSIVCKSNDTTPIEFDENIETNHDTPVSDLSIRRIHEYDMAYLTF
ncbi:hypothetical protein Tco_0649120 [Tanacetum coccineum]